MRKMIPGFADPRQTIMCGFAGQDHGLINEGAGAPTNGVAGYQTGAIWARRDGAAATALYINTGDHASSIWLPLQLPGVDLTGLLATAAELNRTSQVSTRLVSPAAATTTLTLTEALHEGRIVLLQSTGGLVITPPAATGSGDRYELIVLTTISGGSVTIDAKAGNASDVFLGRAYQLKVGTGEVVYAAGATDNLITLDGSTRGGLAGDTIVLIDIGLHKWSVFIDETASGTVATPFSNH